MTDNQHLFLLVRLDNSLNMKKIHHLLGLWSSLQARKNWYFCLQAVVSREQVSLLSRRIASPKTIFLPRSLFMDLLWILSLIYNIFSVVSACCVFLFVVKMYKLSIKLLWNMWFLLLRNVLRSVFFFLRLTRDWNGRWVSAFRRQWDQCLSRSRDSTRWQS